MAVPDENNERDENEDKAEAAAREYMRDKHGDVAEIFNNETPGNEDRTIYSAAHEAAIQQEIEDQASKEKKKNERMMYGAGAGAAAAHTDAVRRTVGKLVSGAPSVYAPSKPKAAPARPPVRPPAMPAVNAPVTASEVDQMMQSIKSENKPTGRQMERGHNWETNRESMATKNNLRTPGAPQAVVEAGPMAPTRGGIAVPENVAREMEEQALREAAARRVMEQRMAYEAEQRAAHEAQVMAQAEQRAAERAATNAKLMGYGKGVLRVGGGALGGALAAKDSYDLYQKPRSQWTDEDYGKAISAAGGLSMTVPTPLTQLGGLALTGAGMAYPHVAPHVRKFMGNK